MAVGQRERAVGAGGGQRSPGGSSLLRLLRPEGLTKETCKASSSANSSWGFLVVLTVLLCGAVFITIRVLPSFGLQQSGQTLRTASKIEGLDSQAALELEEGGSFAPEARAAAEPPTEQAARERPKAVDPVVNRGDPQNKLFEKQLQQTARGGFEAIPDGLPERKYEVGKMSPMQKIPEGCWDDGPRNFQDVPVTISASNAKQSHFAMDPTTVDCDVPCFQGKESGFADVSRSVHLISSQRAQAAQCKHHWNAKGSMESPAIYAGFQLSNIPRGDIAMTVELRSNVPLGYYSWIDYPNLMRPIPPKPAEALAAAFISNCNDKSGRLAYLQELMDAGVKIDSFGRCKNNKKGGNGGGGRQKVALMEEYKFGLAFENSNWPDYVTEKLFQVFEAGAIPVVIGAPNAHIYAPYEGSMLIASDFKSAADLAAEMLRIAADEELFRSYFKYKEKGPSDLYKAVIDVSAPHSHCRLCLHVADLINEELGEYGYSLPSVTSGIVVRVRERNTFYFRNVHLVDATWEGLVTALARAFNPLTYEPVWKKLRPAGVNDSVSLYRVYRFQPGRTMHDTLFGPSISTDADVQGLKPGERLEIIFV
eukprot:scaffold273_cov242-Pinguiococcus_pyrenoidosus.AAC.19